MTYPRSREGAAPVTIPLEDLALSERESIFHAPRAGDLALLGVLVAVLLGNGAWIWRQMGVENHIGRAVFFGMLLLCIYWCAVVYTFKLSLAVCISPRSISVVRGPWRVEIPWSEMTRLMERVQALDGRRYRWVIAIARDGRRISVREDAISDYARFRREAYQRYRVWRDHGGTWGATGSGPFSARETVRDEARWWSFSAAMIALPGLYFAALLPETNPLGYGLFAVALLCLVMLLRAFLQRQSYTIDRQFVESRAALHRTRLTWGEVTKVERIRHPVGGIILSGVALGRLILRLASRGDTGLRTFAWSPRVPEYLILRGGGRQARVRLHRLTQPDELLAWIEFYDQVRRSASASRPRTRTTAAAARATAGAASGPISAETIAPDLSGAAGPLDPWGAGRRGEPVTSQPAPQPTAAPFAARTPTAPHLPDLDMPDPADEPVAAAGAAEQPDDFGAADLPTVRTPAASQDDAWLRETGALSSMASGARDEAPAAQPPSFAREPWGYQSDQPQERPQERSQPEHATRDVLWPPEPEQPSYAPQDAWQSEPEPQASYVQQDAWQSEPEQPGYAPQSAWPPEPQPIPAPQPPAPQEAPMRESWVDRGQRWEASQPLGWSQPAETQPEEQWAATTSDDDVYPDEEETPTAEVEAAQPWRDEAWQPPILPRFGPSSAGHAPSHDDPLDRG